MANDIPVTVPANFLSNAITATKNVDVVIPTIQDPSSMGKLAHTLHLSELSLKRNGVDFTLTYLNSEPLKLKGFDPKVDIIRTTDGDFTLQEIMDHGNNAPYYKQAKINCEAQKNCK